MNLNESLVKRLNFFLKIAPKGKAAPIRVVQCALSFNEEQQISLLFDVQRHHRSKNKLL